MKKILALVIILSLVCGFFIGQNVRLHTISPDNQVLLSYFEYAKDAHQYYADHPEEQTAQTGGTGWNIAWVECYEKAIQLIEDVDARNP